jgi:hypothetical protein
LEGYTTDPIDGRSQNFCLGYGTQRNNVLSPSTPPSKDTVYYGCTLNEKTDFLLQERSVFLPLNRLFTNYSEIKKPELHNDRFTFATG